MTTSNLTVVTDTDGRRMDEAVPGHAAVNGKVDWVGEAESDIHHQDNLLGHHVVHKLVQAKNSKLHGVPATFLRAKEL